jgi:hypothetical protein
MGDGRLRQATQFLGVDARGPLEPHVLPSACRDERNFT